jgi:hypothetical protein
MTAGGPGSGSYSSGPPPAPPRRSNGCLITGLAGCGALILILIIASVFLANGLGKNGGLSGLVAGEQAAPGCKEKLASLQTALTTYRRDHKDHYPAKLADLVPNYLVDDSNFSYHDGAGDHAMEYSPPSAGAPDDAVVAGFETGTFQLMSIQKTRIYVRLLKNGQIVMEQLTRQNVP